MCRKFDISSLGSFHTVKHELRIISFKLAGSLVFNFFPRNHCMVEDHLYMHYRYTPDSIGTIMISDLNTTLKRAEFTIIFFCGKVLSDLY